MLQVARLAPAVLGAAVEPVVAFLQQQMNEDGGGRDRSGKSDLYYTVFLLESLAALGQDPSTGVVRPYLESFQDGEDLDLVHLTCLARCWAALPGGSPPGQRLAERIEAYRAADGGYGPARGAACGTVYHGFLALGALQDLGRTPADPEGVLRSVASLSLENGSYANQQDVPVGATPTTAAAVSILRHHRAPIPAATPDWLLARARCQGGFVATEDAPVPDLLSTATALHALAGLKVSLGHMKESMLDFLDTLWTGKGFCGTWADEAADCEYTYYALLSLGHLSLV